MHVISNEILLFSSKGIVITNADEMTTEMITGTVMTIAVIAMRDDTAHDLARTLQVSVPLEITEIAISYLGF